ncbi:phosphate ABC transporter permease PstA [Allofustis seminis]|uniref:phosphate ABC transporter permease PstA n=1 Tax=Allofustis seminis TaxID=166939 RepID=UPI00035DBFDF|nr:phosphate ABC transporter permease PstA [Allofustis seminis]
MKTKGLRILVNIAAMITFGTLGFLLLFILIKGIPYVNLDFFSKTYTQQNASVLPSLLTTLMVVAGSLLFATPIGVFTAIYLVEYANRKSTIVKIISVAIDTLAAVPSIVYGLFGFLMFVTALNFGFSLIGGILTTTIMILPLIIRSTEEALIAVNPSLREASYGLGAGKLRTIFNVVLPVAMPGILSGIILAIGRIVGESAALIYTLGSATILPTSLGQSGRTMAVHMYMLAQEGLHVNQAYATGVVLIVIVLILNFISTKASQHLQKQ